MKGCVSMFFVLVLASVAGANAVWFVTGATWNPTESRYEAMENTVVGVGIKSDFPVAGLQVGALTVDNTDATVPDNGVAAVGTLHPNLMYHPLGSSPGAYKADDGNALNIVIFQIQGGVDTAHPDPAPAGEELYSFDILGGAADTQITVDDLIGPGVGPDDVNPYGPFPLNTTVAEVGGSDKYDLEPLTIYMIPEPATIALLGLGTLVFLRKRK